MDWNEIMKIENPHKALKAMAHKMDAETLSITEMEERICAYAQLHDIDIDEMAFYPNGGRVLDPDDILTIQYEEVLESEQDSQEGASFSKGEILPYYAGSEIANRAQSIGKAYLQTYLNYVLTWAKSVNHRKISYYTLDGKLKEQQDLTGGNIGNTNGMMLRCFMQNGTVCEGFSDPYRTHGEPPYDGSIHDYIYLWTWDHLDEETHKLVGDSTTKFDQTFVPVPIHEIIRIDAILYSNPRWGGKLVNHFFVNTSQDVAEEAEK